MPCRSTINTFAKRHHIYVDCYPRYVNIDSLLWYFTKTKRSDSLGLFIPQLRLLESNDKRFYLICIECENRATYTSSLEFIPVFKLSLSKSIFSPSPCCIKWYISGLITTINNTIKRLLFATAQNIFFSNRAMHPSSV